MRAGRRHRGIVLVTVLFITILISMFIGAAILVGPRTLGLAGSQDGALIAGAAAESGMQYAIMRIREDPEWRAAGSGLVIDSDDFKVVEDSGYVWGHMIAPNGKTSMFRIRFNFENGDDNGDGLKDSTGPRILTPYVSLNNLPNASEVVVPRASNDSSSSVDDPTVGEYTVPAHGLCLIVEGLTGPGVREFDPDSPNPKGVVHSKVLEGIYVASNLDDVATDAAAMSNSDLVAKITDEKMFTVEAKGGGTPKVRSRGAVSVEESDGDAGKYFSKGTVYTEDATLQADYDPGKVSVETEDATDPFYKLAWDDLKTADPAGDTLAAGTYVWWDDGTLHYYDMDYAAFETHIKKHSNDGGNIVFSGGTWTGGVDGKMALPSSLTVEEGKLTVTGDLYIEPTTAGTADLTIIPREGAPEDPPGSVSDVSVAGPALAHYLANNPAALTSFFADRGGDDSPLGPFPDIDYGWNNGDAEPFAETADIVWSTDGSIVYWDPTDFSSLEDALTNAFLNNYVDATEIETLATDYDLVGANGDLDLETGDTLTPEDLELKIEPPKGESATLSADGNIRIGAKLKGKGASVTSAGTLKVIGSGTDLSATANSEEGVNMYAKGDITLSTLKEKSEGEYEFKDIKLKGLVYTWGDFHAKMGTGEPDINWGKFELEGTLVAFGGDPAAGKPANNTKGKIEFQAEEVKLKFDPAYLLSVMKTLPDNVQFKRASWTSYR